MAIPLMVTSRHKEASSSTEADDCPIAWALKEKYKTNQVQVHGEGIDICGHRYKHTTSSLKLMYAFEDGQDVILPAFITFEA